MYDYGLYIQGRINVTVECVSYRLYPASTSAEWSCSGLEGACTCKMQHVRDALSKSPPQDDDEARLTRYEWHRPAKVQLTLIVVILMKP